MAAQLLPSATRSEALKALGATLANAGIDSYAADARLLLCAAGGLSSVAVLSLLRHQFCFLRGGCLSLQFSPSMVLGFL